MQGSFHPVHTAVRHPQSNIDGVISIFSRYGIPHKISKEWIHTHCPFCIGSKDYHLGYNTIHHYTHCWRCGYHNAVDVLSTLCHLDQSEAFALYQSIKSGQPTRGRALRIARDRKIQTKINISHYRHPRDVGPLRPNQHRYLEKRGFDPDKIIREWGVLGTGPLSRLDDIDYRFRLLIPINWDGTEVSFQTRDVTGKSNRKYLACPPDREIKHHKHILYGRQECWGGTGIIVEGVTDVWRFGPTACAVFGIEYRDEQVKAIADRFQRVAIVFDSERQAQAQARKLAAQLRLQLYHKPVVIDLGNGMDPGAMAQDDANHLVRELIRWRHG